MRTMLTFVIVIWSLRTTAQVEWCTPGARWSYASWQPFIMNPHGYGHGSYVGDTVVDGFPAHVVRDTMYHFEDVPPGLVYFPSLHITRVDGDLLLVRFAPFEWDTIAYFGASPGDRWVDRTQYCLLSENTVEVLDTGTVSLNGVSAKYLDMLEAYPNGSLTYRIVERVGKLKPFGLCPNHDFEYVVCTYSDQESDEWHANVTPSLAQCDAFLSLPGSEHDGSQSVVSLIGGDEIIVQLHGYPTAILEAFDVTGRVLFTKALVSGANSISDRGMATGLILYKARDVSGRIIGQGVLTLPRP